MCVQALIWSKMSTDMPITIRSATDSASPVTLCVLDIDIHRNAPRVKEHRREPNVDGWQGAEVSVVIEGNWSAYKVH